MKQIAGIVPIVAAPFTETGDLDEDSLQNLVRHLLGTGASALTQCKILNRPSPAG